MTSRAFSLVALGLALLVCLPPGPAAPPAPADPWRGPYPDDPDLPEGFSDATVAAGITGATALAVAPDGRVFVCEQTGTGRLFINANVGACEGLAGGEAEQVKEGTGVSDVVADNIDTDHGASACPLRLALFF